MMEEDIIGAIKIKDGLFIGDEFAAQVSNESYKYVGSRVRGCQQGYTCR